MSPEISLLKVIFLSDASDTLLIFRDSKIRFMTQKDTKRVNLENCQQSLTSISFVCFSVEFVNQADDNLLVKVKTTIDIYFSNCSLKVNSNLYVISTVLLREQPFCWRSRFSSWIFLYFVFNLWARLFLHASLFLIKTLSWPHRFTIRR